VLLFFENLQKDLPPPVNCPRALYLSGVQAREVLLEDLTTPPLPLPERRGGYHLFLRYNPNPSPNGEGKGKTKLLKPPPSSPRRGRL